MAARGHARLRPSNTRQIRLTVTCSQWQSNRVEARPLWFGVKRALFMMLFLVAGAVISLMVAAAAGFYSTRPLASLTAAKAKAMQKIMREANPTPPIWPAFGERSWGVTVRGVHPADLTQQRTTGPYITVHVECGWPMRCITARSDYMPGVQGGWQDRDHVLALAPRPGATGRWVTREMPLGILWPGLLMNSLFFACVVAVPFVVPRALIHRRRSKQNRCPRCGYPRGKSEVCTECGARLASK